MLMIPKSSPAQYINITCIMILYLTEKVYINTYNLFLLWNNLNGKEMIINSKIVIGRKKICLKTIETY